jgi:hypothetical protein
MANLTDLGFSKGTIAETIVSTYGQDGKPNAAPMGVIMENEEQLAIRIFDSSLTSQNLRINKYAVLNLTKEIDVFYRTAFKEANPKGTLPPEWFRKAKAVNAPQLCMADATVDIALTSIRRIDSQKSEAACTVKFINAELTFPKVYCRAFSAVVEAIVHATRVKAWANNPIMQEQVAELLTLIANCGNVVERTAPNSQYAKVMQDLTQRITFWRGKQ